MTDYEIILRILENRGLGICRGTHFILSKNGDGNCGGICFCFDDDGKLTSIVDC